MLLFAKKYRTLLILLAVVLIFCIVMWVFVFPQKSTTLIQEALTVPPTNVYDYSFKGCWNASGTGPNGSPKALPNKLTNKPDISSCVAEAAKNNYYTVGLTTDDAGQNECWAGNINTTYLVNDYKVNGPVTDAASCADISQPGPNTLMVYSTLNEPVVTPIDGYRYGGCWTDLSGGSYFTNQLGPVGANTNLSLTDCISYGKTENYDTVAYKTGGLCYGGNQGKDGLNYKKGAEIANNDKRCDVGGPGPNTSIIYTTYGADHDTPILGYDYKGCYNDPSMPVREIGKGFTLDQCINSAKMGLPGQGGSVGKYDTVYFTQQNVCKGATLGVGSQLTPGTKLSNTDAGCNAYYPLGDIGLVYSTSTVTDENDHTNPSYDGDLLDKIRTTIGISGNEPTPSIGEYRYRGYWVDSTAGRMVGNFIDGSVGLEDCIAKAKAAGYNTVSFQNKNQCYAGNDSNYKKYGKPTQQTLLDPTATVAVIYSTGLEPSAHVYCGAYREGVDSMGNVPQPAYTTPQTTTVMFEPLPKTNTIITYSQTPIQPIETSSGAAASASPSSSTGGATDNSPVSQTKNVSSLTPKDKSNLHKTWLPNTPFVYENTNTNKDESSSSSSPAKPSGSMFPNTDLINNQYPSSSSNEPNNGGGGLEFFTTISKVSGKISKKISGSKENIESMSPPPESIPGPFVPKTVIVPPVCPSIPPVIIKTDCSVCPKPSSSSASSSTNNQSSRGTELNNQMTNTFANTNSPSGNPYSTVFPPDKGPSCNNSIRSYDNIPQPYLPSFSGFGM
jgi:hypothetical protein